jgi:hypothetical protein
MNYNTLESLRRLANDPAASPTEREFAERKLREAATALVVVDANNKNLTWRDRVKERTATIIAQEQDRRVEIALQAEARTRNAIEAQGNQERRIERARADHEEYMVNAMDRLEEAQHKLEQNRKRRAAERK